MISQVSKALIIHRLWVFSLCQGKQMYYQASYHPQKLTFHHRLPRARTIQNSYMYTTPKVSRTVPRNVPIHSYKDVHLHLILSSFLQ